MHKFQKGSTKCSKCFRLCY